MHPIKYPRFIALLFLFWSQLSTAAVDYYMVVAKDGSGEYKTIQSALDNAKSFPDKRITIFIKNGTYREQVNVYPWNPKITLLGESEVNTIISYDSHFKKVKRGRNSTFHTATLNIQANDVHVENLTVENTSGDIGQAIALSTTGDRGIYRNIQMLGNQDTLYVAGEGRRNYFSDCYISGTTDFIFGEATTVFEKCQIHSKKDSYITAASTPENQKYGLVFFNSKFTAENKIQNVFLGRPWRPYAKTVIINSELGSHIHPEGWSPWGNQSPRSVYYAEYKSVGPGAKLKTRAGWTHELTKRELKLYSVEKILLREGERNWLSHLKKKKK